MARRSTRSQATEPQQLSSPPATPLSTTKRTPRAKSSPKIKIEAAEHQTPPATTSRKRGRKSIKEEDAVEDATPQTPQEPPAKKKRGSAKKTPIKTDPADLEKIAEKAGLIDTPKSASKKKQPNYRLTPGNSPYPTYAHPTREDCEEVVRLLSKVHGKVNIPKEIRAPSLTTAGCGEVPSVLDALIRTRLSAATTNLNSSRAFQGLVKTFGTLSSGIGAGSVDWNAVRLAPQKQVFEAIKCGGLADNKSRDIKAILDSVWAENQERAEKLKAEDQPAGGESESKEEKHREVELAEQGRLSLDHLHLLSSDEAFNKLVAYPGIGPKTASCVLLFCLRRPSFAVDTHVFRLCKYLGWVPSDAEAKEKGWPRVERNTTYSHCDVRVPDEHKYALHYLLIRHGKTCGRCRAATGMGSEGWKKGCPIEHLVTRHGAKKGGNDFESPRKRKKGEESEPEVEAEMSDLGSDEAQMSDLGSIDEASSSSSESDFE